MPIRTTPWPLGLLLLATLLQSTLSPIFQLNQRHPDLIFVFVLAWVLAKDFQEAMLWAFLGGLIIDMLAVTPFGIFTLSLLITAILAHVWHDNAMDSPFFIPVLLSLPYSIIFHLSILGLLQILGYSIAWTNTLSQIIIPVSLMNMGLMLGIVPLVKRLARLTQTNEVEIPS